MLSVVCWKWKPLPGYRSEFTYEHVNCLHRMVRRNLLVPHRFICITDSREGLDPSIDVVELWNDFADLPNPHGGLNPSCYRRLKAFAREMDAVLGKRFISIDLDCVITGDITPLVDRHEDFVIWGDQLKQTPYNGSMWMMNAGARAAVWEHFDPVESPTLAHKAGFYGSDQAWMSYKLGPNEARWTRKDGVYAFRTDIRRLHGNLPIDARIVFFQGAIDPWTPVARKMSPWIEEYYR